MASGPPISVFSCIVAWVSLLEILGIPEYAACAPVVGASIARKSQAFLHVCVAFLPDHFRGSFQVPYCSPIFWVGNGHRFRVTDVSSIIGERYLIESG